MCKGQHQMYQNKAVTTIFKSNFHSKLDGIVEYMQWRSINNTVASR